MTTHPAAALTITRGGKVRCLDAVFREFTPEDIKEKEGE